MRVVCNKIREICGRNRDACIVSLDVKLAFNSVWWPEILREFVLAAIARNLFMLVKDYPHRQESGVPNVHVATITGIQLRERKSARLEHGALVLEPHREHGFDDPS